MTRRLRAGVHLAAALVAAAATAAGCGEDFDPYTRLTSLRVLAIKSEVTTQPANASGGLMSSPGPGDTVTLTPLMYVPADDVITSWSWRWCPLNGSAGNGYRCAFASAEDVMAQTGVMVPSFDLGNAETAMFTNSIAPELIGALCAGIPGVPVAAPNCEGGYPIQIEMRVESMNDPGIDVVATLRLRIDATNPALPPMPPNYNPVLDPALPPIAAIPDFSMPAVPIPDVPDPAVTLRRDFASPVIVGLSEDQAEPYTGLDDDGNLSDQRERLTLSWFVESGDMEFERTAFIQDVEPISDTIRNGWTPAITREYMPDTARVVVIIRDNRGGIEWARGNVRLGATP
jgi:hypothetical protein